jgi:hypothetical protein
MRTLTTALDWAQIDEKRKPAWKIIIYDARSGTLEMSDVVLGGSFSSDQYRDFTADCFQIGIQEQAGDYAKQGIASSQVVLQILDPHGRFDPLSGDEWQWLRQGNIVRIWEGDARVPDYEWPITFTGEISGQAGVLRSRAVSPGGTALITAKAIGRESRYLQYKTISTNFSIGTQYRSMAEQLATDEMQLDAGEIDFSGWGNQQTGHATTQFIEEEPLVSIAKIMFADGYMPRFDGEGMLTQTSGLITKAPSRIYENDNQFIVVDRIYSELNGYNRIVVLGLASELTEVLQPRQLLKQVDITTGYFTNDEELTFYWSEDQSVLAKNIDFVVLKGMNDGISIFGSDEESTDIPSTQGEGTIGIVLTISTGFAPYVVIFLALIYVILAIIPDTVLAGAGGGITISVGRLIQAVSLAAVLFLMAKIGRGSYEWYGEPFEYIFEEIRRWAEIDNLQIRDRNELVVTNHLIQEASDAQSAARNTLFREQAKQNKRAVRMFWDARLEPDDVFEMADGSRIMIESISRTLVRGQSALFAELKAYDVTPGRLP